MMAPVVKHHDNLASYTNSRRNPHNESPKFLSLITSKEHFFIASQPLLPENQYHDVSPRNFHFPHRPHHPHVIRCSQPR